MLEWAGRGGPAGLWPSWKEGQQHTTAGQALLRAFLERGTCWLAEHHWEWREAAWIGFKPLLLCCASRGSLLKLYLQKDSLVTPIRGSWNPILSLLLKQGLALGCVLLMPVVKEIAAVSSLLVLCPWTIEAPPSPLHPCVSGSVYDPVPHSRCSAKVLTRLENLWSTGLPSLRTAGGKAEREQAHSMLCCADLWEPPVANAPMKRERESLPLWAV